MSERRAKLRRIPVAVLERRRQRTAVAPRDDRGFFLPYRPQPQRRAQSPEAILAAAFAQLGRDYGGEDVR